MFLERFEEARKELPDVETVIVVDGEGGDMTFDELESRAAAISTSPSPWTTSDPTTCSP